MFQAVSLKFLLLTPPPIQKNSVSLHVLVSGGVMAARVS